MFNAIHSLSNTRINSISVGELPDMIKRSEIFYAPIEEIKECPKEIDISKIIVKFRSGSKYITSKGQLVSRAPHFYILNASEKKITTFPESMVFFIRVILIQNVNIY